MLSDSELAAAASRLHEAERTRRAVRPFSLTLAGLTTLDDAYAVQRAWVALKLREGRVVRGHKVGLTSRAMQLSSNIDQPDSGVLLDDMFFADGSDVPGERFITPRVEVELAFVLGRDLRGPDCTIYDVLDATRYVTPALEIIDARLARIDPETGVTRTVLDTISDNAANAGVVLGGRPVRPQEVDLRWVSALLYRNGVIEETGVSAGVLGHPANGVVWLVNRLATLGEGLAAGQVVLAGSFTRPVDARAGDTFHVEYGPLGSVSCRFAP